MSPGRKNYCDAKFLKLTVRLFMVFNLSHAVKNATNTLIPT